MTLPVTAYPWDRQPSEPSRAFAAFTHYRDLHPHERSLSRVASDLATKRTSGKPPDRRLVERWSRDHAWVARAAAWDSELDHRKQAEYSEQILKVAERQAEMLAAHQSALSRAAIAMLERFREEPDRLQRMSDSELMALTAVASRVLPALAAAELAARGVLAERRMVSQGGDVVVDDAFMTDEEHTLAVLAALAEMFPPGLPPGGG